MKTLHQAVACWRMSILLVLRVSFTLFNLQGARRNRGWTFSLPHGKPFVKNFFQAFSNFFSFLNLSTLVFARFLIPLNKRSINIPNTPAKVKHFFQLFWSFFTPQHLPFISQIRPQDELFTSLIPLSYCNYQQINRNHQSKEKPPCRQHTTP